MNTFCLEFHHQSEKPTDEGTYVLYNQCDGFHIAECWLYDGKFEYFNWFAGERISEDFYAAWAKLPDSLLLYRAFADEPTDTKSAHAVCIERLESQREAEDNANYTDGRIVSLHTPGPWKHYDDSKQCVHRHQIVSFGKTIAHIYCTQTHELEDEANAKLIAAAPKMANALVMLAETIDAVGDIDLHELLCEAGYES